MTESFSSFLYLTHFRPGLSWEIVLKKRPAFRKAFHGFDPTKVARYGTRDLKRLLSDADIIRNRAKASATIANALKFLEVQREWKSFDRYIWGFVGGRPKRNRFQRLTQIPSHSNESQAMSRELHKRGFRFVGPTICYAFMQAAGMVNDHLITCFRYRQV